MAGSETRLPYSAKSARERVASTPRDALDFVLVFSDDLKHGSKIASYGQIGSKAREFCRQHKRASDVDLK